LALIRRLKKNFLTLEDLYQKGNGFFSVSYSLGHFKPTSYAAELADLDGDSDLDIVVGNDKAPNRLFFNDETGNFDVGKGFGGPYNPAGNITLNDFDNDGDLDIAIGKSDEPNCYYLNNGNGSVFRKVILGTTAFNTYDIKLGDLNGDALLDVIEANSDALNLFYLNISDQKKRR